METIKIKNIPIFDRPRERLMNSGAHSLSNEELLSILLCTGTKNMSVKELSSFIISKAGGISKLYNLSFHELIKMKGVGKAKACTLLALAELSKRMNRKYESFSGIKLNDPKIVFEYYKSRIDKHQEKFYCIYLDANKKVIEEKMLFIGTLNHSLVHPRDIFKEAYKVNAAYIICVHNHPSGDAKPSTDDIWATNRIKQAGNIMGIKLVDHVIVTENTYYSFLENGKI